MEMTRRGFMAAMFAAAAAPAIVRSESLMRIVTLRPLDAPILTLFGDGITDDTAALQAIVSGAPVMFGGRRLCFDKNGQAVLTAGHFLISNTIHVPKNKSLLMDGCTVTGKHTSGPLFDLTGGSGSVITNSHFRNDAPIVRDVLIKI